ncbi:L,D-transpeptidase family protein [Sedimentitalea nanhaiensis]|uniref:L,D-transpeptidase catalytic domain n=1 Tax=Sedimentitalea nanhaiensis TaxID=999627 RepID=A0A1I7DQP7_9RHOB|nr:L,D-transpeptidase family protein [Sedimentitalea nanhaiensis]SFU13983.1 L,D-transpeptidase catalytic domain [Sedimentitalea nanhaiensis]
MKRRVFGLGAVAALAASGCSTSSKFKAYNGPEVTSIVVNKGARRLYLLHNEQILKDYKFELGFAPEGHKQFRGDGKTPEGSYLVDRRNPRSAFHLSVGISYPNSRDIAFAKAMGKEPGGDIFIHGQPNRSKAKGRDWTAGCIAVQNHEIEDIYAMVPTGTLITLRA